MPQRPKSDKLKDRLYTVRFNPDGSPIVLKDKDGKSDNQRKREHEAFLKTLNSQQLQDYKNKVKRDMETKQKAAKVLQMRMLKAGVKSSEA
jgi:hypothetical protein